MSNHPLQSSEVVTPRSQFFIKDKTMIPKFRSPNWLRSVVIANCMLVLSVQGIMAQSSARIVHDYKLKARSYAPYGGRDLWFTMAQNYDAGGANGKYYMLYVASPNTTTVNIQ